MRKSKLMIIVMFIKIMKRKENIQFKKKINFKIYRLN